jgi:protein-tyrosine-phosphatase
MNSVRSPMAAALLRHRAKGEIDIDSAGVYEGGLDPFVEIVMEEIGAPMDDHEPKSLSDVDLAKVDLVVALTPDAAAEARRLAPACAIEYWEIENPSDEQGSSEEVIGAYRRVRDALLGKLRERFPEHYEQS